MWWMMCIISMLWQQLSKLVNKAQSTSFPHGKHANLLLCLQLRCIIWSGDNSAHKDTCACAAHPNYRDWHSLTNVDGLVCNYGNSNHWNCMMTSTDIGPGAKNILRLAAVFCHRVPQLAIKCCRKQLLTQQGADALEDAPSKSGGFFRRRGQKIFWYRSFQQLPLIHLSLSCKYHPPSMSSHLPCMAQEDVSPHHFLSAQMLPRTTPCPRAVLLFTQLKITWKCQVTVGSICYRVQGGPGPNKSITDN